MYNIVETIKQSPPLDPTAPYDEASGLAGKTIVITGGASGFGAAFARRWAARGARIIIGDVADAAGEALVADLRRSTGRPHHHYLRCDVASWDSQAEFFREAALRLSSGLDAVVANAGIRDVGSDFCSGDPPGAGDEEGGPSKPNMKCLDVNITGVMYTAHLAMYWLSRNDRRKGDNLDARDRHLLLIGSIAGLMPFTPTPQYTASKHAVVGLFRALRGTAWRRGVRVNMLCPYFIRTPIVPPIGQMFLAGSGIGSVDAVVDAGTRLVADGSIVGRALAVGPRVRTPNPASGEDEFEIVELVEGKEDEGAGDGDAEGGREGTVVRGAWEIYAHDYEAVEVFVYRFTRMLHHVERIRGWTGWVLDYVNAIKTAVVGPGK